MRFWSSVADVGSRDKTYHCGTLTYTKIGLAMIFVWLLWGDFCWTLMEAVAPTILPLKLKSLGCSNWLIGLIMTTVPGILNMTVCPYISVKSDRYRSKWGRRLPFIIWTMPFLCISLALLGWSDDISTILRRNSDFLQQFDPAAVTIVLIAIFTAIFQFFNMFVGSIFYYLFNDVVPAQFIARFIGLFKIAGAAATALYNYFLLQYAESNMREIFLGAAIIYFIGFGIMCFRVKEGEYPPFEKSGEINNSKGLNGLKNFFKESFTHKFYWLMFLLVAFQAVTNAINTFNVFFYKDMGLSLKQIGEMNAITGVAALMAMYFTAIFIDRWHPMRVVAYVSVFTIIGASMNWIWVFVKLPANYFFWLFLGSGLISAFQTALAVGCGFPLLMRVFPQSRFGQFCSAQALFRSFCFMVAGVAAGLFIDLVKRFFNGSDFAYRFIFIWTTVFSIIVAAIALISYLKWYRLGGDTHYHPPAPWNPTQVEELTIVPSVGPQFRWLNISFRLFYAIMVFSVLGIPCLMWWMYYKQTMIAFYWHGILLLPLSLVAWRLWILVKRGICRDIERAHRNISLHNGIPHHGVLIIVAIKFLLAIGLWLVQVIITVNMNLEHSAIVFTIANIITEFLLIGGIYLMCRIERFYSTTIDKIASAPV